MLSSTTHGVVDVNCVDRAFALPLQREFFDAAVPLPAPERELAARLSHALADAGVFAVPEDAALAILERLEDLPNEPLSFHLRRWFHRAWLTSGKRPREEWCRTLPAPPRFVLSGVRLGSAARLGDAQAKELHDELMAEAADDFWAVNFEELESRLDRREDARAVYNRLLALLLRVQSDGVVPAEYAGLLRSFSTLAQRAPQHLVYKLGLLSVAAPSRIRCNGPTGPDLDITALFNGGLGDDVEVPGLLRALAVQPPLRTGLAAVLRSRGLSPLAGLRASEQVSVLATSAELLGSALSSPVFADGTALRGAVELLPVANAIGPADGGVVARVRAHLWVGGADSADAIMPLLPTATDLEIERLALELLAEGAGTPLMEWIAAEPRLLCESTWARSSRLQQVAAIEPELVRPILLRSPAALESLLSALAVSPETVVPVARRLLGGWEEAMNPMRSQFTQDDGRRFAAVALIDPAGGFHTVRSTHTELKAYGPGDYAAGLRYVHFVSDRALESLSRADGSGIARCDREVLQRLFVSSARYGQLPGSATKIAADVTTEAAAFVVAWLAGGRDPRDLQEAALSVASDDRQLALAVLAGTSAEDAEKVVGRLLRVDAAGVPEALRRKATEDAVAICAAAREAIGVRGPLGFDALTVSDAGRHVRALVARLTTWREPERVITLVLRGAAESQRARFQALVVQSGVCALHTQWDNVKMRSELVNLAMNALRGGRADAERIADRAGDEVIAEVVRAALGDLVHGREPWMGSEAGPRALLVAVAHGPWVDNPGSLARALQHALADATAGEGAHREWIRAIIYALGKLREPLGGKVPATIHAIAGNPALSAAIREVASEQEELWNDKNMKIQRKYTPAQRVRQAMQSLALGGSRAGRATGA